MAAVLEAIDAALHTDPLVDAQLNVPQKEAGVLAAIDAGMIVHTKEYEGNNVHLSVTGPASLVGRFARFRLRKPTVGPSSSLRDHLLSWSFHTLALWPLI